MTDAEIQNVILTELSAIAPETEPARLAPTENVREVLDIDSYDFLRFLIGISEKLGIEVPEKDYNKFVNLEGMVRYISKKMKS